MYFMDLKLIAPLKRLNLIVETYPVWCKMIDSSYTYTKSIAAIRLCAVPSFIALRNSINFINLIFAGNYAENPA